MTLNRTKFLAYLKERWIDTDDLMMAIMVNAPILGMMEKSNLLKKGGKYMHLPQLKVGAQGRSADYARALANATGSDTVGFDVSYVNNFQIAKMDGDIVNDSEGDDNAIAEAADHEMETVQANMRKDLQLGIFGNAGGARGRIGSITTGIAGANMRIVLLAPTDSKFFEIGMLLQLSANDGTATGHTLRDSGNRATITGVDKMQGFLEFGVAVATSIAGAVANDYIFADGDFKNKISGFRGWIPTTAPVGGDSFHGVDRSASPLVLSGLRIDATGKPIEQGIVDACGYADQHDVHPDLIVVNPVRWAKAANSLGADRANRLSKLSSDKATISYEAIMIATNFGEMPMVSDSGCGIDEGLGLKMSSWVFGYSGPRFIHIIGEGADGLEMRRAAGADAWQTEVKCRGNMGCRAPGRNMRLAFSPIN